MHVPAAFALRRCVAWVAQQATAHDIPLLRASFGASAPLHEQLDALFLMHVSSCAQRTLVTAANSYAATAATAAATAANGSNSPGGAASVDWPHVLRESSVVCDSLGGLAAGLSAAAPDALAPSVLARLDRAAALLPHGPLLVRACSEHIDHLVRMALASEELGGPMRASWVQSVAPSGKQCAVLGSAATLVASLSLHAGGALFGVLPSLDAAFCDSVRFAIKQYSKHVLAVGEACVLVARGLGARGDEAAAASAGMRAAAADGALPAVCIASVAKLRHMLAQLATGELPCAARGEGVPRLQWSEDSCVVKLREAVHELAEAERRLQSMLCDGAETLVCVPAIDACAGPFWPGRLAWRHAERCSLPTQHALMQLHSLKMHVGALGDAELARTLYVRTVRRCGTRLLRAYWCDAAPSEKRDETFMRDLRALCAIAVAEGGAAADAGAVAPPSTDAPQATAPPAAAAAGNPPVFEDSSLPIERERVGKLALWLLSLLALHRAPLPVLADFVRSIPVGSSGVGSDASDAPDAAVLGQVGGDPVPEGSPAATAALEALALSAADAPADAPVKFDHAASVKKRSLLEATHAKVHELVTAPLPDMVDWAALLRWDAFPLRVSVRRRQPTSCLLQPFPRSSPRLCLPCPHLHPHVTMPLFDACRAQSAPHLVRRTIRRLPALQPVALEDAKMAKPEEAEAVALESRIEILRLVGAAEAASHLTAAATS
jgi:hypothetical protein